MCSVQLTEELGIQLRPVDTTFVDMAVTMYQLGIAKPQYWLHW